MGKYVELPFLHVCPFTTVRPSPVGVWQSHLPRARATKKELGDACQHASRTCAPNHVCRNSVNSPSRFRTCSSRYFTLWNLTPCEKRSVLALPLHRQGLTQKLFVSWRRSVLKPQTLHYKTLVVVLWLLPSGSFWLLFLVFTCVSLMIPLLLSSRETRRGWQLKSSTLAQTSVTEIWKHIRRCTMVAKRVDWTATTAGGWIEEGEGRSRRSSSAWKRWEAMRRAS